MFPISFVIFGSTTSLFLFGAAEVVKNDEIEDLKDSLHRGGGVIARKSVGEPHGFCNGGDAKVLKRSEDERHMKKHL